MKRGLTGLAVILVAVLTAVRPATTADLTNIHLLDNGLEVRLFPDRSTPLVATLVLVKAGYAVDGPEKLGFSHLLEHLVFAGTEDMDKEALFDEVRSFGGYLNGFTREDYMGYLMVGHRDHFQRQMELLSAILFRAPLRDEDVESARKVVIEEIRRRASRPDTPMEETFQRLLYEGSSYATTGVGNEKTVGDATAEEIRSHYRRYYRPGNMILLSAGSIDDEARSIITETFGAAAAESPRRTAVDPPAPITGRRAYRFESSLPGLHVKIGFNGPDPRSGDAEALELLAALLGGPGGVLQKDLKNRGFNPRSISAGLALHPGFSRFIVSASFPEEEKDGALDALLEAIGSLSRKGMFGADLARARNSLVAAEIMGREKLHYFLMGKAPWVVAGGPGQGFSEERWDDLSPGEVGGAAARYLAEAPYGALVAFPESPEEPDTDGGEVRLEEAELDNGLHVIAEQRRGSKVFALNVLTRRRSSMEPAGMAGIADMLHRLLPRGTILMTRAQLEEELREIGGDLSTAGNPTMPFGDFYTSRSFSFLRLQAPVDRAARAAELAAGMIGSPALRPEDVEDIARTMKDYISFRDAKPDALASRLLAEALYGKGSGGADVLGDLETISSITPAAVADFQKRYFTGRNLIISVVSGLETKEAIGLVRKHFAGFPPGTPPPLPELQPTEEAALVEFELGRPQGAIAAGAVGKEVPVSARPALSVVAAVLNERLYEQLREKEGLAYSVGASLGFVGDRPVWQLSMGTSPEKIEEARRGIAREVDRLRESGVTAEEILRSVNERTGRLQMRMLSSLNRGFYLALAERYGFDHRYGDGYRQSLLAVTPEEALAAIRAHVPGVFVEAIVR